MQSCSALMITPTAGCPISQAAGCVVAASEPEGNSLPRQQISDVGNAMKREHVVHAQRLEWDVADDHKLVVALVVGKGPDVERDRGQQLGIGTSDPPRRLPKAIGLRVTHPTLVIHPESDDRSRYS